MIVKADGTTEPFDIEKLRRSLHRAGAKENVTEVVLEEVSRKVKDGMTTNDIYRFAFNIFHREQKHKAFRYSLRRAVYELGPTGFGFEKFVAEIFKAQGYQVKTDQIVQGYCVEHEVDVIAWDEKELLMCEAKFHNDIAMKSDLKVALYVKARMEDLGKMAYDDFGAPNRKMTEGWLITNTKFSSAAIQYGMCQNLKMIGWNFPHVTNLHNMIEITKTIPLTVLTTLNGSEKRMLIERGVVLCRQLTDSYHLDSIGINKSRHEKILVEAKSAIDLISEEN